MYSVQTGKSFYGKSITALSVLTVLFGFGSILLGYLFMPFAAASYAALLTNEKKHRRIASYLIPILLIVLNYAFNGFYSMEGVSFVMLGWVIYFTYSKGVNKSEAVFYSSFVTLISLILSILLSAFEKIGGVKFGALAGFFSEIYYKYKDLLLSVLTKLTTKSEEGITYYIINADYAEVMYQSLILTLIPLLMAISFVLSGIAFKMFKLNVKKHLGDSTDIEEWNFKVSNFIAFFYVIVAIVATLAEGSGDILALTVCALSSLFSVVLGYIGAKFVFYVLASRRGAFFALAVILFSFVIFSNYALSLLSYIGVYYTVISNKKRAKKG